MQDPISQRQICERCWNGLHHAKKDEKAAPSDCRCLCLDVIAAAEKRRLDNLERARAVRADNVKAAKERLRKHTGAAE